MIIRIRTRECASKLYFDSSNISITELKSKIKDEYICTTNNIYLSYNSDLLIKNCDEIEIIDDNNYITENGIMIYLLETKNKQYSECFIDSNVIMIYHNLIVKEYKLQYNILGILFGENNNNNLFINYIYYPHQKKIDSIISNSKYVTFNNINEINDIINIIKKLGLIFLGFILNDSNYDCTNNDKRLMNLLYLSNIIKIDDFICISPVIQPNKSINYHCYQINEILIDMYKNNNLALNGKDEIHIFKKQLKSTNYIRQILLKSYTHHKYNLSFPYHYISLNEPTKKEFAEFIVNNKISLNEKVMNVNFMLIANKYLTKDNFSKLLTEYNRSIT